MKTRLEAIPIPWRLLAILFPVHLVLSVYYLIRPGSFASFQILVNTMSALDAIALGTLCLQGSRALLWPRATETAYHTSRRFSPLLLGMAIFCFGLSSFTWVFLLIIFRWYQALSFPNPAQLISLGMYPLLISAVLVLPTQRSPLLTRLRLLLDSLIIMIALITLCYYFIVGQFIHGGPGSLFAKIIINLFPSADAIWLLCLLFVTLQLEETTLRLVLTMLGFAGLCLFIIHLVHLSEFLSIGYRPQSPINALYMLAGVLITGAAQTVRHRLEKGQIGALEKAEQTGVPAPMKRWKSLLSSALVLIFSLLTFGAWLTGGTRHFHGQIFIVYAASFVVLILMVCRQFLAVHEVNTLQKTLQAKNRSLYLINEQLEQQAITDSLTGLPNHQALLNHLDTELARTKAQQTTCSILFIDIDHFKSINDKYGHPIGDMILCHFSGLVESTLRSTDYLGRWGGEEFLAVLPETTSGDAFTLAERLRLRIARQNFTHEGKSLRLTCSLGLATYPDDANKRQTLIMLADTAMYAAKHLGRNQTRIAHEPGVLDLDLEIETPPALEGRKVLDLVKALLALQTGRDRLTGQHERRVATLARKLALSIGLSEEDAYIVSLGGLLHDLGKIALPDALLLKRGKLTEEEFSIVRAHPVMGAQVLEGLPAFQDVAAIVRSHHEWMNGSGYPDHLAGEAIPLGARIVAVADAYDVITHHRPYQSAHTSAEALLALQKHAGPQFDPVIVNKLAYLLADTTQQHLEIKV